MKKKKTFLYIILAFFLLLTGINLYLTNPYKTRFSKNTTINNINVSNLSLNESKEKFNDALLKNYQLKIIERTNSGEIIKGSDIDLKLSIDLDELLKEQSKDFPIIRYFKKYTFESKIKSSFNKTKLKDLLNTFTFLDNGKMIAPTDAYVGNFVKDKGFQIIKETDGTKLYKDKVFVEINNALLEFKDSVDLDKCYERPVFLSTNETIIKKQKILNDICKSKIEYSLLKENFTLDSDIFNEWISLDDTNNILIDNKKVSEFVDNLSKKANTAYTNRQFLTRNGDIKKLQGPFGYKIDKQKEIEQIKQDLLSKQEIKRTPIYSQVGKEFNGLNDLGNSYVEIDLTNQRVYLIKDNQLISESNCVSGNISKGNRTPDGIYSITYKQSPAVLRGANYASPVKYWMPFNKGIGLHDATWRSKFGGSIYKTNGSHGCINLPLSFAKTVYENVEKSMPVICYY